MFHFLLHFVPSLQLKHTILFQPQMALGLDAHVLPSTELHLHLKYCVLDNLMI